ncbi:MAG: cell division protein FtsA, partial [Clostridia bacterium]|nr:cell division protein FtsA [Clostridia bacterium]
MAQRAKAQAGPGKRGRPSKTTSSPEKEHAKKRPQGEDLIFALDIGTRTMIGVVGERLNGGGFLVKDYELMEHPGRAMIDGQVEDIAQVGRLILEVQRHLEERLGVSLSRVSIAAAGRMLKTARVCVDRDLPAPHSLADRQFVVGLEGEAIELAQEQIRQEGGSQSDNYYCVGYSIIEYRMDGHPVSQLAGHTCSHAGVELIAAFLPYSVVEGLYAAVDMTKLEVASLTLEPIAAINVLIPRELRLLNLTLVDVGAGTSDIAICRDGRIASYEMATIAGDELSEAIVRDYLVDFSTAERLKRSLTQPKETLNYENVLGMPCQVKAQAILDSLQPGIDLLAQTVADKILKCNGGPPAAVFLIGGGSQVPGLSQALAACL